MVLSLFLETSKYCDKLPTGLAGFLPSTSRLKRGAACCLPPFPRFQVDAVNHCSVVTKKTKGCRSRQGRKLRHFLRKTLLETNSSQWGFHNPILRGQQRSPWVINHLILTLPELLKLTAQFAPENGCLEYDCFDRFLLG